MQNKHRVSKFIIALCAFFLFLGVGFRIYVSDYYRAGPEANRLLQSNTIVQEEDWLELKAKDSKTALIFYPGAKVEYTAYLPQMEELREQGISCYLVEMPFNLAFLGANLADKVVEAHPEIETWYIGGHSLGGAFSSAHATKHADRLQGLILVGAYPYGGYPDEKTLVIYGSNDEVLNKSKAEGATNVHVIQGGNHAQFGDYGKQKKDGEAQISAERQRQEAADIIREFIK